MAEISLSKYERTYIIHSVQDNLRIDGRSCEDYRELLVETDLISNANGSARVKLGDTDVLVGIKAELAEPDAAEPNKGRLEFSVDCSANATPEFEGRGGEDLAIAMANALYRAYDNAPCIDRAALCVLPAKHIWVLFVDIMIMQCGGNLYDAAGLGVKAALHNTRIPVVKVEITESGQAELEISDDPYDCSRLDVTSAPCVITVSKIGQKHLVDSTLQEEACALTRLILAVTNKGTITAMKKDGPGSLDPESIFEMLETGKRVGRQLNETLMEKLRKESEKISEEAAKGFLVD